MACCTVFVKSEIIALMIFQNKLLDQYIFFKKLSRGKIFVQTKTKSLIILPSYPIMSKSGNHSLQNIVVL